MGGSSSRAVKRISSLLSNGGAAEGEEAEQKRQKSITSLATPFVFTRWGSMYIDEDGDVAHEFYVESASMDSRRTVMRRITTNIKPQGEVSYDVPRLHGDLPIIICER